MRPFGLHRFRRLGLQRRIMLYVTGGLAMMFAVFAFLGLGAIGQATDLVYQERLTTAYTTAGILERDFARLASDTLETGQELSSAQHATTAGAAADLLDHLDQVDPYQFFSVRGVWLLGATGRLLDQAGEPVDRPGTSSGGASGAPGDPGSGIASALTGAYAVLRAAGPVPGAVSFADIAVRLGAPGGTRAPIAVVHTVSSNSASDFIPALYGRTGLAPSTDSPGGGVTERYHLEIVDPDGIAVLGIGPDEHPGSLSPHYAAIKSLMATGAAAARLHEPGPGDSTIQPHVMAVVPLPASPFYLVLEQPVDVALALPLQLRNQLLLTTGLGFVAALALAWMTTRRVVKPTEQLTAAAERMAGGDLASPIDVSAQDEVGRLAESLEAMRHRLKAATEASRRTNLELERLVDERTARLGQLLRQTISAQEEERRRLARELHDETAQTLAALSIALDRARDGLGGASPEALARIGDAREIADRLLAETRRLIMGLRPAVLDDMGLLPAIRWYSEGVLVDHGVDVTIEADQAVPRLPAHIEVALFRIVQEAITNVAKHADAHHVWIRLSFDDTSMAVTVTDDGHGFDVDRLLGPAGPGAESVGLVGMQERVRLLDGQLEIRSVVGGGTTVSVRAPIADAAA